MIGARREETEVTPALAYIIEKHLQQDYEEFLKKRYPRSETSKEDQAKKRAECQAEFIRLGKRKTKEKQ